MEKLLVSAAVRTHLQRSVRWDLSDPRLSKTKLSKTLLCRVANLQDSREPKLLDTAQLQTRVSWILLS